MAHKGASKKQALTAAEMAELVDCYRRIQKLHASLNYASPQQLPLLAASATVKAAWAELSGAIVLGPWAWPTSAVPMDGISPHSRAQRAEGHDTSSPP